MTNEQKIDQLKERLKSNAARTQAIYTRLQELGQDKSERYALISLRIAAIATILMWRIIKLKTPQADLIKFERDGNNFSDNPFERFNQGEPIISPN